MKQVPITRFRREIRKWLRKEEAIEITRNKKVVLVFMPTRVYDTMLSALNK